MLRKYLIIIVLVALCASAFSLAEEGASDEPPMGWGLFATAIAGDEASKDLEFHDSLATLDDGVGGGALFFRDMSESFRFEMRVAYMPTTMLNTENGDISTDLFYFDFSLIPKIRMGERFFLGIPFGLGWGLTKSSDKYVDQLFGRTLGLGQEEGSGAIYFLGFQGNFKMNDKWELFADLRARRFHRLVNVAERTVKSFEFSFGFTKIF